MRMRKTFRIERTLAHLMRSTSYKYVYTLQRGVNEELLFLFTLVGSSPYVWSDLVPDFRLALPEAHPSSGGHTGVTYQHSSVNASCYSRNAILYHFI